MGGEMPLNVNARLDPPKRNKLKQMLRRFYQQLLNMRIPDRLRATGTIRTDSEHRDQPEKRL
jgi:hypothetical protein